MAIFTSGNRICSGVSSSLVITAVTTNNVCKHISEFYKMYTDVMTTDKCHRNDFCVCFFFEGVWVGGWVK